MSASSAAVISSPAQAGTWRCAAYRAIDQVADTWDQLVASDQPHMRSGMLRAAERGKLYEAPTYLVVLRGAEIAAIAYAYSLRTDTVKSAPAAIQRMVARVRERAPGFMWRTMRVCGSPISNCRHGICFAPDLSQEQRREAIREIGQKMLADAGMNQSVYFREFSEPEIADFAGELERLGFFRTTPWPNMVLEIRWKKFDDYLAALRKRYRKRIRDDMKTSSSLTFELVNDVAGLAPLAVKLYQNVLANADFNLETLTAEFFAAVSDFPPAKLLVARRGDTGEVVGVNLLLFGETQMQNLFIGFDYEQNKEFNIYFSLVQHSLRLAIEHGCQAVYFGQDSYEFKSRLGARPVPLAGFMKHRVWPVHWLLRATRHQIFPPCEAPTHDVFQGEVTGDE